MKNNKLASEKGDESHEFWDSQPIVKKYAKKICEEGPISSLTLQKSLPIPEGCYLTRINIEKEIEDLLYLLKYNYVEDEKSEYRLDYTKELLIWYLLLVNI